MSDEPKRTGEDLRKLHDALAVAQIQYDAIYHYRKTVSEIAWQRSRDAYTASSCDAALANDVKKHMYHDNAVLAVMDQNWKALDAIKRQVAAHSERPSKAK